MISKEKVQEEFNLNNFEIFNSSTFEGNEKTFIMKLLDANNPFKLFALSYCVLLPVLSAMSDKISGFLAKIGLPGPPLAIGSFVINFRILYFYKYFIAPGPDSYTSNYYIEMREMMGSMTFMSASVYFFFNYGSGLMTAERSSH